MNIIRTSIERPIAIIAAVLMILMFGLVALETIPIQLAPDVNRPLISVSTVWPGAAPAEVEREIVNRQEEVLAGIASLVDITGRSEQGRGRVTLEFEVGTNMDKSLLLVSNRLDRVTGYPFEVDEPTLKMSGSEDNAIAWFIITQENGRARPIHEFGDFVEDVVRERLERVPGVGEVNVYGGSEREIQVTVEPAQLSRYGLTVSEVVARLRAANISVSAGDVEEGKRRWIARVEAELNDLESARSVMLRSLVDPETGRIARVMLDDIATVEFAFKKPVSSIRMQGIQALAMNAKREVGANVIETMDGIETAIDELNGFAIPNAGLKLVQVYKETVYIKSAISLVQQNIWIGGTLAAIILMIFLRSFRATLVVSLAIPVSVVGSFVAMAALGRSINVISLAGFAFAVGMVVDAAIVVLENIFRLREQGKTRREAAYEGARQVWGAVFVSALTTVMVFIPILVMELEVGQLFRDIAVAISVSVLLSLVVSVTVLPSLASKLLPKDAKAAGDPVTRMALPGIDHFAKAFVAGVMRFVSVVAVRRFAALGTVLAITLVAALSAWLFLPKLEYLPDGNRNLIFGIVIPPPGYNLATMTEIAERIETATKPYWKDNAGGADALPDDAPMIERFFFVAFRATTFIGAAASDPSRAAELKPVLATPVFREPGTFALISQLSLFGRGFGGGRKIELDISGPDLEANLALAGRAAAMILGLFPQSEGHQFRPNPGLELGAPEVRLVPDRLRLADNGISVREFSDTVDAFNDGLRVAEITVGAKRLDLTLKGPDGLVTETQGIGQLPVVTADGMILPAASLARIDLTAGPTEIRHRDRARTITLEVVPSVTLPLQQALEVLQTEVIGPLLREGLPPGVKMRVTGTADKLTVTWNAMLRDLLIALAIVYLVMAVLFESFIYPLVIMLSVPLAAAGGVAGLAVLNIFVFQALDMLTLLGFVILVGIVVNNAILLVHQALFHLRQEGMAAEAAIREATRNRIRPIFMSTLTSIFGMLPLVLFPGAGSELYRGLGSVVVGGLSLSALLTLLIVPPMLSIVMAPLENEGARDRKMAAKSAA